MRYHDGHASAARLEGFDHVQDERVVALSSGRQAATEAPELVLFGGIVAPLLQRERRVGDHHIEVQQVVVAVEQARIAQGVAPLDDVVVLAVQEHVHLGQRPGAADRFLSVELILLRSQALDLLRAFHQQRSRTAGRIADAVAFFRLHQFGHQFGDFRRRVELAGLLAGARGETLDQELIRVADDVELADAAGAQVEFWLGEIFEQMSEYVVLLRLVAETIGVEGDVLEHAVVAIAQLAAVAVLDRVQGLVDALAIARLEALLVQRLEIGRLGQHEAFVLEQFLD